MADQADHTQDHPPAEEGEVLDVERFDPTMQARPPAALSNTVSLAGMSLDRLGDIFAASGMFRDASDPAKAMVKIIAGAELGLSPFASMTGVYIVEGKPTVGGHLLAGILRNHPRYRYEIVDRTSERCELAFFEKDPGTGEWAQMEPNIVFTIEDAQRAELASKANYRRYPRAMLFWRALSEGTKIHAPDVFGGIPVYTPDELGVEIRPDGSVVGDDGPRPGAPTSRSALPPRAQAQARTQQTPTPRATGTRQPTERTINAAQKRKLWTEVGNAGLREQEDVVRALMTWTTGAEHSDRIPVSRFEDLLGAIADHEAALAALLDLAASGDEQARAIVTKYLPGSEGTPMTDDDGEDGAELPPAAETTDVGEEGEDPPPAGDDLDDPERLPL